MKSFDTELKKYAEKVHLKARERSELRERVLSYMEYHPLPKKTEKIAETIESQPFFTIHFNSIHTRIFGSAFAVLLLILVPIAAERSVPGDVLYLVKTGITEKVQSQFANSPYEKVELETRLIERRIAEARLLANEGKLTEEVEASIAATVKEHADAAQDGLEELRGGNADEAAIAEIAFDSALEVQSAVLSSASNKTATSTQGIADAVRAAQADAVQRRASTTPSFEGLMGRVESETTRAYELFESIRESATEEELTNVKRRLADIDRNIQAAQEVSESDTKTAISELSRTLGLIHKLIVFMTDIDVRENVDLETLVPVELTVEERTEAAEHMLKETERLFGVIETRIPLVDNTDRLEKITIGVEDLKAYMGVATTSLKAGEIDSAESAVVSAFELANDLDQLTLPYVPDAVEEIETEKGTTTDEVIEEKPTDDPETDETVSEGETVEETTDATTTEETVE